MLLKLLCLFFLLDFSQARYGFVPKFYGQDSAVIIDTDKPLPPPSGNALNTPNTLRLPPPFPMWQHFPRYHIIPPPPPGQILAINSWPKNYGQKPVGVSGTTTTPRSVTTNLKAEIKTTQKPETTTTVKTEIITSIKADTTTTPITETTTTSTPQTTTTTTPSSPPTTTTTTTTTPFSTSSISSFQSNLNINSHFGIETVPFVTDDEFPKELLDIARNKLGLRSLDEIPSISELGQLLGTNSPQETLSYIKQLTSNDQGVALMKAYIESTDYTDNTGISSDNDEDDDGDDEDYNDDDMPAIINIEEPLKINDEGLVVVADNDNDDDDDDGEINDDYEEMTKGKTKITTTPKPSRKAPKILNKLKKLSENKPGFFERMINFMHLNQLWHKKEMEPEKEIKNEKEEEEFQSKDSQNFERVSFKGNNFNNIIKQKDIENIDEEEKEEEYPATVLPILVRDPIPFNYPVPLRPQKSPTSSKTTTTTTPIPISTTTTTTIAPVNPTSVHLNAPKLLIPHVQHLAKATNISPRKIEDFLATKPKLVQLANKVSRFPIGYDRNSPLEAQVLMAVKRAIEQDEDLKKLLNSSATLK